MITSFRTNHHTPGESRGTSDMRIICNLGKCHFLPGGGAPENWGGSGTLSKIKRGDQKIFSN